MATQAVLCLCLAALLASSAIGRQHLVAATSAWVVPPQPVVVAEPAVLEDGDDVVVSWSHIQHQDGDYIAAYCPAIPIPNGEVDFGTALNAQRVLASMLTAGSNSTAGSMVFKFMINMRCDYLFRYVSDDGKSWSRGQLHQVVAASNVVKMRQRPAAPQYGHLALTGRHTEMRVTWVSGTDAAVPTVQYGRSATALTLTATGSSSTFTASDMCSAPANVPLQSYFREPGYTHDVLLTDLEPGMRYYYRFGTAAGGWSAVSSLEVPPLPDASSPASFLFWADMSIEVAPASQATADLALQDVRHGGYSFVLHTGDMSYAMGFSWMWEFFMRQITPVASLVPYMVGIGNHEYDEPGMGFHPSWGNYGADGGGECGQQLVRRFHMPTEDSSNQYWYSYNYGMLHIVVFSTEHNFTVGSPQYEWIQADLAAVDRATQPWIVISGHRAMYILPEVNVPGSNAGDIIVAQHMRAALEPLLVKYRVNLMLSGHTHSYQRSCPVIGGVCQSDGKAPVHLVVGTAGADLDLTPVVPAAFNEAYTAQFGYLQVEATKEALTTRFILNVNASAYDEATVQPWL